MSVFRFSLPYVGDESASLVHIIQETDRMNSRSGRMFAWVLRIVVSLIAAFFSVVMQRSSGGALHDGTKNSCKGDYTDGHFLERII